ncbi:hypothetical protein TRFO_28532 [Tritrichomonas foetus]|uniref:Translation initiation factor eIF2B subunit epsilon n=1 Tax=Tritrichomonas foetus TaxID=1144522 RepID=A0A1J4K3H1_9EUKA|nr:hypothetical protein TRFO_28532 [Tritrichomonas foetus]|eukprot:OHT04037.1 hypothetical protein TRFO_28532 [Tritrichomonas foetus]
MPAKNRGRHARKEEPSYQDSQQNVTVGFVLCHPMDSSLTPITAELPPCLFPLCNSPVLLYVLNWLNINGIEKIYIVCQSSHANFIKKFTQQCRARMLMDSITILDTEDAIYSFGDALRWIDHWNQHYNVFKHCVVVPGTLITNVPLKSLVKEHEDRFNNASAKDLKPILTICFTQSSEEESYSAVVNDAGTLLHLHAPPELSFNNSSPLKIDPSFFKSQKAIRIKTGLNDSHIYICNTQILANFTENFDWHNVANDCIPSQLRNVEILRQSVYSAVIQNSYAATIDDLPSYLNASLAVVRRWLYPVTLEMNIFAPNETYSLFYADDEEFSDNEDQTPNLQKMSDDVTAYRLERDLVYLYDNVFPDLTAKIGHSVVIGSNTELHENCIVKNSVIGSGCVIGKNAVITDSILWDHVTVEEGAHIRNSLIASDVRVCAGVSIDFGCICSFSITIDIDLPPCRRLTGTMTEDGDNEESFRADNAPEWLKNYVHDKEPLPLSDEGNAFEFVPIPEHEYPLLRMWNKLDKDHFPIDPSEIVSDQPNNRIVEEEEEETNTDDDEFIQLDDDFQEAAADLLASLIQAEVDSDQIRSEYVSLKNSKNAEHIDCGVAIMIAITEHWSLNELSQGFELFNDLLSSFLSDVDTQEDFLFWWQSYCAKNVQRMNLFTEGMKLLMSNEIISDDALDKWGDEQDDCNAAQNRLFDLYLKIV